MGYKTMNKNTHQTAWLFPGQGSQTVGMGRDLLASYAPARELLAVASDMAGVDFSPIIARGPDALLTRTDNLQPALTVLNLGCCMLLQEAGIPVHAVAGHSLGEFSALYAAGVLNAHDVLRLVVARGQLMHEVSSTLAGGMLAVKGDSIDIIEAIVAGAAADYTIGIANYNTPTQTVLSGESAGLMNVMQALVARGEHCVPLNVSGPWHSPLLQSAAERFIDVLHSVEFQNAHVPVILNVTGTAEVDAATIRAQMELQLCNPVRWTQVQRTLHALGIQRFVEVGPGKILRGLLRGMPELSDCDIVNIDGPKSLRFLASPQAEAVA